MRGFTHILKQLLNVQNGLHSVSYVSYANTNPDSLKPYDLFICVRFYMAFNTVQFISRQVAL